MIVVLQVPASGDSDSDLKEVGRLDGLGKPGESIFSVRFMRDRAFVVRQVENYVGYRVSQKSP
jgi:uncharacterized secreted protein with C-terminal beta-propeller domain